MVDFVDNFEKKQDPEIELPKDQPQRKQRGRRITYRKKKHYVLSPPPKLLPTPGKGPSNLRESFMSYHKNKDGKKCVKSRLRAKLPKRQKANNFLMKRNQNLRTRNKVNLLSHPIR